MVRRTSPFASMEFIFSFSKYTGMFLSFSCLMYFRQSRVLRANRLMDLVMTISTLPSIHSPIIRLKKAWAEEELKPKVIKAYQGEGEYIPGPWCAFCRASTKCRERADEKLKLAQMEFKMPPLLTDREIEEILSILPDLTKWADKITAYATDAAVNNLSIAPEGVYSVIYFASKRQIGI